MTQTTRRRPARLALSAAAFALAAGAVGAQTAGAQTADVTFTATWPPSSSGAAKAATGPARWARWP